MLRHIRKRVLVEYCEWESPLLIRQGALLPSCLILDLVAFTFSLCLISSPETLTGKTKKHLVKDKNHIQTLNDSFQTPHEFG